MKMVFVFLYLLLFLAFLLSFFINQNNSETVMDKTSSAYTRTLCITVPESPKQWSSEESKHRCILT